MNEMKEDQIIDWIENLEIAKTEDKKKSWFSNLTDNIVFELSYWWRNSIMHPIRRFFYGISNFWRWRKIIWNDRWWDYYYFLEIIRFKLKDMEENWGTNTHYMGDYKEKETLKELLKDLEWMIDEENWGKDGYEMEYKKRSKRFFGKLDRNHRKLWD